MSTPAKFTLTNVKALELMTTQGNLSSGVCITPVAGGMSVDGYVNIGEGLSVMGLGNFTGGVSISGGVSITGGAHINSYHYPTSLGTSQFLYYKDATAGVSGYGLSEGTNITLTYEENFVTISSSGGGGGGGGGGVTTLGGLSDAYTDDSNITLGVSPNSIASSTFNTAVGISALFDITTGTSNTVVGYNAGESLTIGEAHVAIGVDALKTERGGVGSVAVGYNTLSQQNNSPNTTTNVYNTAVGWGAGSEITTGTSCTFIGASAGSTLNGITGHNITCLGFGARPSAANTTNEVTLGNTQITTLRCADQTIASLSDARDKNDIRDLSYGLNFLENVRPVEFTWDRRVLTPDDNNDPKQGKRRAGFIAQELQEAMPNGENDILDLVYTSNPQRLEAKYGNLIPVMVKAIQDLKQEVDTIKEHLNLE